MAGRVIKAPCALGEKIAAILRALMLPLLLATVGLTAWAMPAAADTQTRTTSFAYDANGLLRLERIEPGGGALTLRTDYSRDAFGNIVETNVQNGARVSTTRYDARGQFAVRVTNALGHATAATYDRRFGSPLTATDPNGFTVSWTYDDFGRKTSETRPDGTSTSWEYHRCRSEQSAGVNCPDRAAYRVRERSFAPDGETQNAPNKLAYYDLYDRVVRTTVQPFQGPVVHEDTEYDRFGNVRRVSRPYRNNEEPAYWTSYEYDLLGRPVTVTEPGGEEATTVYSGLKTVETNFLGQTTATFRNARDLIVRVRDALGNNTRYAYDAFGNLVATTDSAGNVSTAAYDVRGRRIAADDPDMGAWSYSYNRFGELVSQTDAKGQVTNLTYDALGRVVQRVEPDLVSTWTWDTAPRGIGQLAGAETSQGYSRNHSYDALGRPRRTDLTQFGQTARIVTAYDESSRVRRLDYPSGLSVEYLYNARGYLYEVRNVDDQQPYWTADAFDPAGNPTQATAGNGVVTQWTWSTDRGLLTGIAANRAGSGNALAEFGYRWDVLGNLRRRTDERADLRENLHYDALNRLIQYRVVGQPIKTVSYDALGNIEQKSDVGSYSYDPARPHAVAAITPSGSGNLNTSFTYDANGNMTAGGGRTVTWTSFDMVRTITQGVVATSFDYDGEHNRIRQVTATETTHYFWAGALGAPAEKVVAFGGQAAWKEYILAGGETVAQQVTFLDGQGAVTSTHRRYFVNDHLGSIAVVLDEAGAVLERLSYDAWGKRRNADWTDDPAGALTSEVSRGYTGHEMLDGFGLVHMNGRIYDPVIGRFLSPDPHVQERLNGQNLNRYAYVLNNPLSMTDPSGYFFSKAVKSIGRAIGRAVKSFAKFVASRQGLSLAVGAALMHALPVAAPGISPYLAAGISGGVSGAVASGTPEGALMGMVTATSFAGIGHALPMNGLSPAGQTVAKAGLKGLVSGGLSAASGGKFQAGFLSASFSALAAPHVEGVVGEGYAGNLIGQGLVGGLASELGGGKFANGFHTGAFNYMFNDMAEMWGESLNGEQASRSCAVESAQACLAGGIVGASAGAQAGAGTGCVVSGPACVVGAGAGATAGAIIGGAAGCAAAGSMSLILCSSGPPLNPDRPSDRAIKNQCIRECTSILERPRLPGRPWDGNETDFHKCVAGCIRGKKE